MSRAELAAGIDRLPWLPDEPTLQQQPQRRAIGNRELLLGALAATLLVAVFSYWMGARSWEPRPAPQSQAPSPSTTVAVPQPTVTQPQQPQVPLESQPQVSPAPVREVPLTRPSVEKRAVAPPASQSPSREEAAVSPTKVVADQIAASDKATVAAPAKPEVKPLKAWPATQSQGAKGRIVRVGAFGTRQQAKLGWRYMVRAYPAVAHLKATVVGDRNSHGRRFYRFQIGTTSQAHSEVLCQRMDKIRLSCAVVGLALDPKGVER